MFDEPKFSDASFKKKGLFTIAVLIPTLSAPEI